MELGRTAVAGAAVGGAIRGEEAVAGAAGTAGSLRRDPAGDTGAIGTAGSLAGVPLTSTSTALFGSTRRPGGVNCSRTVSGDALSSIESTLPSLSPTASNLRAASATGSPRRRGTTPEPWLAVTCTIEPIANRRPGVGFWTRMTPIGASGCCADRFTVRPK